MLQPNRRGLAFLLSLAAAPAGCFKDAMRGGDETSPGSSSGGPTESATAASGTGSSGDASASMSASTSTGAGSGSGGSETTGAEVDEQCVAYASNAALCGSRGTPGEPAIVAFCAAIKEQARRTDGEACLAAFEAFVVCAANAMCSEFADGGPCVEAMAATEAACPGLFPEETTGTGTGTTSTD